MIFCLLQGAIMGLMVSLALTAWISFGSASTNVAHQTLPVSIESCPANNSSVVRLLTQNETSFTTASDLENIADFVTERTAVEDAHEK